MTTQNIRLALVSSIAAITLASAAARASNVIGVDFYVGSTTSQAPATTDSVGPYASTGWYNEVDPSTVPGTSTLIDNSNTLTTAQFSFTQGGNTLSGNPIYNSGYGAAGSSQPTFTPNQQLYNGTVSASASSWSQEINLTNVPYSSYSVYLLVYAPRVAGDTTPITGSVENFDGGRPSGTAGTTYYFQNSNASILPSNNLYPPAAFTYTPATGTSFATATSNANYVLFSGLTNANESFDLLNDTPADLPYSNDVTLGAIEIVDTSGGSPVPEPATLSVFGTVAATLLLRRRRSIA